MNTKRRGGEEGQTRFPRHYVRLWRWSRINWMQRVLTGRHIGRRTRGKNDGDWPFEVSFVSDAVAISGSLVHTQSHSVRSCTCHFRWPCHSAPFVSPRPRIPFSLTSDAVSPRTVPIRNSFLAATGPRDKNGYLHLSHLDLLQRLTHRIYYIIHILCSIINNDTAQSN